MSSKRGEIDFLFDILLWGIIKDELPLLIINIQKIVNKEKDNP